MTIKPLFFIVVIIAKQSFASSDINVSHISVRNLFFHVYILYFHINNTFQVCLERHTPIRMYNYASGQCLSSSNTEAGLKLQMHGCVVGDEKLAFFAHRASVISQSMINLVILTMFNNVVEAAYLYASRVFTMRQIVTSWSIK